MDIITQGLAGALVAQSAARPGQARRAAAIGLLAGMLADADILIRSPDDPLLNLEYHRQFTHSLAFVPLGGLIAALLLWPLLRRRLEFGRLYLFAVLGFLPSGLLDTATSFGTQLLWPFSDARIAWNAIAIVDPLFSLILVAALGIGIARHAPGAARLGLVLAVLYLLIGVGQRERAEAVALQVAQERGHRVERIEVKPTLGNLLLWRSIYESDGRFHVDAVRAGVLKPRVYEGGTVARFEPEEADWLRPGSVLEQDIARFTRFSDGFVARHPQRPWVLGDVRYAMLPTAVQPLWGIEMDPARQDRHVEFRTFRQADAATRQAFWDMLRGRPSD